jgi:hypothetical protein
MHFPNFYIRETHEVWELLTNILHVYYSELVLGSVEQNKEDRKQQLKDQAEEERRMKILTS